MLICIVFNYVHTYAMAVTRILQSFGAAQKFLHVSACCNTNENSRTVKHHVTATDKTN